MPLPSINPASLEIVHYPHPVLLQKAKPLAEVTDETRAVARRMIELMHLAEGIGLAAPQVGLPWRMFVVHIPEDAEDDRFASANPPSATLGPRVFINPILTHADGKAVPFEEGCLSLPEIRGSVLRPELITVTALDEHGQRFELHTAGLFARCLQHENDHLDGILILQRMSQLARIKNRAKIRDLERAASS